MHQLDFNGQVAVVTGGAQGIGAAVARRLAASGARVAIWDMDQTLADATASEIGSGAVALQVNVADWEDVSKAFD